MMVVRSKEGFAACRIALDRAREQLASISSCESPDMLLLLLEVRNIVETSTLMLEAGSQRQESRGGHFRKDYPLKDDTRYAQNYFMQRRDGRHVGWFEKMADYRAGSNSAKSRA